MVESTAIAPIENASSLAVELWDAATADEVRDIEDKIDSIEGYMRRTGLYSTAEIRPVNETRMWARWKLGGLLKEEQRGTPGGRKLQVTGLPVAFHKRLQQLRLSKPIAIEAQRINAMPKSEVERILAWAAQRNVLATYDQLVNVARPYWYQENRQEKHRKIAAQAKATIQYNDSTGSIAIGPFPLLYADPPWQFEIYSEKGADRTPEQHYPTLSDDEIIDLKVYGHTISEIANDDAALFLWCTSSNVHRALRVMDGWGFTFKSSAVWVKDKSGLGLVFRNQHELILYGTRGDMPGPQYQPSSVFNFPRGPHSAKPPEIRQAIERMYPDFDETTRLELFARGDIKGWTTYGFEAGDIAA